MKTLSEQTLNFKREKVIELLSMCTQPQQDFFKRIFPYGVDRIPEEKLDNAYDLCYRTIVKNQKQKDAPQKSAEAVVNSI